MSLLLSATPSSCRAATKRHNPAGPWPNSTGNAININQPFGTTPCTELPRGAAGIAEAWVHGKPYVVGTRVGVNLGSLLCHGLLEDCGVSGSAAPSVGHFDDYKRPNPSPPAPSRVESIVSHQVPPAGPHFGNSLAHLS